MLQGSYFLPEPCCLCERRLSAFCHAFDVGNLSPLGQRTRAKIAVKARWQRVEEETMLKQVRQQYQTTDEDETLWRNVLLEIEKRETGMLASMARRTHLLSTEGSVAVLAAANAAVADLIQKRLGPVIPTLLAQQGCLIEQVQMLTLKEKLAESHV